RQDGACRSQREGSCSDQGVRPWGPGWELWQGWIGRLSPGEVTQKESVRFRHSLTFRQVLVSARVPSCVGLLPAPSQEQPHGLSAPPLYSQTTPGVCPHHPLCIPSAGVAEKQAPWFWIHVVLPTASLMLILVLVILLIRMERVWVILMPRIPNPSKNFDELFNTHQGNFPEWAGVSKDVVESFKPNYSESFCYVSELSPKEGSTPLWEGRDKPRAPSGRSSAPASSSSPGLILSKNSYVGV
ncbi:uncharacterized protein LOC112122969, partial [Terrapene carolina triunguis]|uniref:uncharacterized protein LOC112122969 n=1 Tax=Terrapene triunguis TaxID=2587831 RepID=UPI000E77A85C